MESCAPASPSPPSPVVYLTCGHCTPASVVKELEGRSSRDCPLDRSTGIRTYDHFIGTTWVDCSGCSGCLAPLAASLAPAVLGSGAASCVPHSSLRTCTRCCCTPASCPSGRCVSGLPLHSLAVGSLWVGTSQRVKPGHCCPDVLTN